MSNVVDSRVVEMRFDNQHFERNVSTTMSTLDKLKQRLNLSGATKGLEDIDSASRKMNFSGLGSAVDTVHAKFSALQVMGVTALANITNSAVNAGKRIVSALTIDPIKTGFSEYETQINAVQTILANTSSKGTTLKDVNSALDELNTYADKTIYNFTEMTRNIGTFTAAGVDLDTSVSSIQGIANLAAVSGSTSQQASTAMYQLSQALAAGKVSLMDWNSVVNAGMGGQVFQDALKRTSEVLGTGAEDAIKKYGSFRESLTKGEWLTTEVLTKTLEQFTMAAEEGSKEWENYKKSLMDEGYTEKQATEILKMANTATDAATKVKTFTQLWDTLKEAAQSGWTQTWEILVGDFEEAKSMLTNVSNVINEMIGKSAEARNKLLQGWKDAGGRDDLLEGFKSIFNGAMAIITPIKEAFRDIFPSIKVDDLVGITKGFKELTKSFENFTDKHGDQIYSTFKGIFSVLDVGWTIIKKLAGGMVDLISHFTGVGGGVLGVTASIGDFLTNISKSIKESDILGDSIDFVVDILTGAIDKIKEFGSSLKEGFKADGYEGFVGFLKATWEFVSKIGSGLLDAFSGVGKAISNVFGANSFGDVLESGGLAALSVGLFKLVGNLNKPFDSISDLFEGLTGKDGVLDNVIGMFTDVRECFQAYQQQLQAGTLVKIATAIGILSASIFVISTINPEKLGSSLGAITVLFGELLGSLAIFTQIMPNIKGVMKAIPLLLSMASALLILSVALKIIGSMKPEAMITGLIGVAGGLGILVGALHLMPEKKVYGAAKSIRKLASALLVLSIAMKVMSSMSWTELGKGLSGIAGGLTALVLAVNLLPKDAGLRSIGMIGLATSLVILGGAIKIMSSMSWKELGIGLTGLVGSLMAIVIAMRLMPKNLAITSLGLLAVSTALVILSSAMKSMGSMSWEEIGKGLTVLGGALVELSIGLNLMRGTLSGSASLLIAAGALAIITPILKTLGGMSWGSIAKGLVTLAGAFAIIGIAGALMSPLIPTLLGLSAAFALFGISVAAIGAGLTLIGIGIGSIAGALAAGATSIIASITVIITGILDLVPTIVSKFGEIITAFCKVIGDCAPQIADTLLKLVSEVLASLAQYTPLIADSLFELLMGVLDVISARLPELISAAIRVIGAFFQGVVDALSAIDTKSLLQGVIAVGLLSGLMFALSAVAGLVPGAMVGVLGVGIIIAELALVLAAIGALAQIPGLEWLISEGGDFLQKIGTAIGQFVGGLIGGMAQGITSSLPQMASDLSTFMTNLQPFIDGAKSIDASILEGVKTLAGVVIALTGADLVSSLASFITGGNSLADFGAQLVPFGESMRQYSQSVVGIDANAIVMSATAAKALSAVVNSIPKSGGLAGGETDLAMFGQQLVPFGTSLKAYSLAVAGIDTQAIVGSAAAAKAIAEMANHIPNEGGMIAWFTGDNSLANFGGELIALGVGLKGFAIATTGIVPESIIGAANAAKSLAEMMSVIPNEGGLVAWLTGENSVSRFGEDLIRLGFGLKGFAIATTGIVPESIVASANAAKALAEMMSVIPNEGGLVAWLTGENSVSTFASQLASLGSGLASFSVATAGIVPENIIGAAGAAKSLAEMTSAIPNEGGVAAWFTGENSIASFASQLPLLGMGLAGFSVAVAGIVPENITSAVNAAKALAELTNHIPTEGGVKAWFTGESSIATFASNLPLLGTGLAGFSEAVTGINAENVTAAAGAAKALAEMTAVIPTEGGIKAWFTGETSIANFADKLPTLGEGLAGFSEAVAGINPENVTAAAGAAKALAEMADTTPKNTDKIIDFGENLVTFGDKLKSYFDKVGGITAETLSASSNAIKSMKDATSGLDASSIKSASTAIGGMVTAVKKLSNINESSVSGFNSAMKKLAETNVKSIVTAFDNAGPKMTKAGETLLNKFVDGAKKQESKVKKAGETAITKFVDGLKSKESAAKKACESILKKCVNALKGSKNSFYSAGAAVVTGFASGISDNTWRAEAKAKAMANAAEKAAKKALDINSPSKVFRRIGTSIPEGFAMGIEKLGYVVKAASVGMTDTAIDGVKGAISKIADAVNTDIDSQPTIRPVLDLSDIKSGAGAINGILGLNPSIATLATAGSISSMMNRNQNGVNADVVSAINKLRSDLSNLGGNSYNINGITYDDGSNVSEAIKTLVRATKVERRI